MIKIYLVHGLFPSCFYIFGVVCQVPCYVLYAFTRKKPIENLRAVREASRLFLSSQYSGKGIKQCIICKPLDISLEETFWTDAVEADNMRPGFSEGIKRYFGKYRNGFIGMGENKYLFYIKMKRNKSAIQKISTNILGQKGKKL